MPMKAVEEPVCQYTTCDNCGTSCCDQCNRYFCSDHGTKGGDREGGTNCHGNPYGAYAVPSRCWNCGGFNADFGATPPAKPAEPQK